MAVMARIGVDYETIKQAAVRLLSQGIAPSVQKMGDLTYAEKSFVGIEVAQQSVKFL